MFVGIILLFLIFEMSHYAEKRKSSHTTIAIVVPTAVAVVASLLIFICICLRKRKAATINLEGMNRVLLKT